jgi:hypothetical protein
MASMLFAHQGGWDEALLVLSPLLVIGALLWLANHRATKRSTGAGERAAEPADVTDGTDATD